jgi:hypothetical protein
LLSNLISQRPAVSTVSTEIRQLGFHLGFQKTRRQHGLSPALDAEIRLEADGHKSAR